MNFISPDSLGISNDTSNEVDDSFVSTIGLVGPPNAGKSTLLNNIIGEKISIVSSKAQTTRFAAKGIRNINNTQLVFVDTPGIFSEDGRNKLEKHILKNALSALSDLDEIVFLFDGRVLYDKYKKFGSVPRYIIDEYYNALELISSSDAIDKASNSSGKKLKKRGARGDRKSPKIIYMLNKYDVMLHDRDAINTISSSICDIIRSIDESFSLDDLLYASGSTGENIPKLMKILCQNASRSPWLYCNDEISNIDEKTTAEELTREVLYKYMKDELPYSIAVKTDLWRVLNNLHQDNQREDENKDDNQAKEKIEIYQSIYVLKQSQKAIVIGRKGQLIRQIAQDAKSAIEDVLGIDVVLHLFVKVRDNWIDLLK